MTQRPHERGASADLVESLSRDLAPVVTPPPPLRAALLWLALAWAAVLATTALTGPFRPDAGLELVSVGRFALECALGWAVGAAAIWAALELGMPGGPAGRRRALPILALLAAWVGLYAAGLIWPTLPVSMLGKRPHCAWEVVLLGVGPLLLGLWVMRHRLALDPAWAGLLIGIAAGSLPALVMQWACMYTAGHILQFHLGPAAVVAAAGWLIGPRVLPRV